MPTNNAWNSQDPAQVAKGGTGVASLTAYNVVCAGTTSTAALQPVGSVGTSGQFLTSAGAGALPTWTTGGTGSGLVLLATATASASSTVDFTSSINSTYTEYEFHLNNITISNTDAVIGFRTSSDSGSTWDSTISNYAYSFYNGASGNKTSLVSTYIILTALQGSSSPENMYSIIKMQTPSNTSNNKLFIINTSYDRSITTDVLPMIGAASRVTSSAINAIRFLIDAGTFSGTIRLYGVIT